MNAGLIVRRGATFGTRIAYRQTPTVFLAVASPRYTRTFSSTRTRWAAPVEDLNRSNVQAGTEGLHRHDTQPAMQTPVAEQAIEGTAEKVAQPNDRGDWVLFHPVYTSSELKAVEVLHREPDNLRDRAASFFVKSLRKGFDLVSGYRHKPIPEGSKMSLEELRKGGYVLTEAQWMTRILFLETIAGVPGFFAAMIRHLKGLRSLKRDGGWIHTLLEEAENERMHLMTFMTLRESSIFFRAFIVVSQGVFANAFFIGYLISPRTMHRFVGALEEEATLTYTALIKDIESGLFPEWENVPAPNIAIDYWRLKPDAKLLDVIYAVRSDETTHRFVNHTFANLKPDDINPFALGEPDMHVKGVKAGFTREEAAQYLADSQKAAEEAQKKLEKEK